MRGITPIEADEWIGRAGQQRLRLTRPCADVEGTA
jgi:hypothetical protein